MSKTYVIQWKSKVNGRAGKGTKLFELEEAEALAAELNEEYPDIDHHAVESAETALVAQPSNRTGAEPGNESNHDHSEASTNILTLAD